MKVLFVCTGNTCRSAIAEAIFKDLVDLKRFQVSSAGLSALSGDSPTNNAVIVCDKHGIDLMQHKTTSISDSGIENMDLVLTATQRHRDKIKLLYPNVKVFTIKEYAGGYDNLDIADPIIGDLDIYENSFMEIKEALEKIADNIQSL